jgi:hypothetical protein
MAGKKRKNGNKTKIRNKGPEMIRAKKNLSGLSPA